MSSEVVTIVRHETLPLATLLLNRPDKRNALNAELVHELGVAHRALLEDESVRVIALRGAGTAFCAGADLASIQALQSATPEENLNDSRNLRDLFTQLYESPKPLIAAVDGPALAGGAGLATVCDFVIATSESVIGYPEVKIGFVAAMVMVFLTRQIGERKARDLLLTGRALKARAAMEFGLINQVVPQAKLDDALEALATKLIANAPQAMALTKELLPDVWGGELLDALDRAADANVHARATSDCREGIAAFLEKRKPEWKSK